MASQDLPRPASQCLLGKFQSLNGKCIFEALYFATQMEFLLMMMNRLCSSDFDSLFLALKTLTL